MITMLILGRAGRNQNRLSRWQWWLFDNLIVMVRYCQYQLRWYLGGQADVEQWQWWSFDYFYGDILPILTAMIPGRAGRNQTRLSKGTWEGVDTISGVICISVNCHFFLLKKIHTKRKQRWYWTTSSTSTFRGDFPKKSCCSFGFCPNYLLLPLPPIWTTCTTFLNAKNVNLSNIQNDSLSKILLK